MPSVLNVDTLVAANGTDPVTLTKQSAAKAWCTFQGTGTVSIKDSLNASSITDANTGNYTITLANSLSDTNYNVQFSTHGSPAYADWVRSSWYNSNDKTTSSYRVESTDEADNYYDILEGSGLLHGDLA